MQVQSKQLLDMYANRDAQLAALSALKGARATQMVT
jgi:hypothetical protein